MKRPGASTSCLALVLVLLLAGCNAEKSGVVVTGRLVENGEPLKVSAEGLPPGSRPIQLVFHALPSEGRAVGESFYSAIDADTGEFTIKGPSDKGIPAGKYRISVAVVSNAAGKGALGSGAVAGPGSGAPTAAGVLGMSDRFKGAFSRERTPLEVEITRPTQIIVKVGNKPGVTVP